ncbi:hypothetical protein MGN70_004154 [Eutypa lata]|nr:hypothetical protein MGN70_004154 [Eutypa lata]
MQIPTLFTTWVLVASTLATGGLTLSITSPGTSDIVQVGSPFTIKWDTDYPGKVDVTLLGGNNPNTLQPCGSLTGPGGISNVGSMQWDVSGHKPLDGKPWDCTDAWNNAYGNTIFGIRIQVLGLEPVYYSVPFKITP